MDREYFIDNARTLGHETPSLSPGIFRLPNFVIQDAAGNFKSLAEVLKSLQISWDNFPLQDDNVIKIIDTLNAVGCKKEETEDIPVQSEELDSFLKEFAPRR